MSHGISDGFLVHFCAGNATQRALTVLSSCSFCDAPVRNLKYRTRDVSRAIRNSFQSKVSLYSSIINVKHAQKGNIRYLFGGDTNDMCSLRSKFFLSR